MADKNKLHKITTLIVAIKYIYIIRNAELI